MQPDARPDTHFQGGEQESPTEMGSRKFMEYGETSTIDPVIGILDHLDRKGDPKNPVFPCPG